jgi:hypothetical protein
MTSPLGFLFADTDEIIAEINYDDEHIRCFNFRNFCKGYQLEPADMHKCLFACLMYFLCHKSLQHKSKLQHAILQPFANFAQTLTAANKQNATIIDSHIRSLGKVASKFDLDQGFCEFLGQIWGLRLPDIISHANLFYNSPVLTNNNRIINQTDVVFRYLATISSTLQSTLSPFGSASTTSTITCFPSSTSAPNTPISSLSRKLIFWK